MVRGRLLSGKRAQRAQRGREIPLYAPAQLCKKLMHVYPVILTNEQFYFNNNATAGSGSLNSHILNNIDQGDDIEKRLGNTIRMRWLYLNLLTAWPTTGNAVPTLGRIVVLYDREPDGTAMQYTEAFDTSTSSALAFTNLNGRDRFEVLYSKTFMMMPTYVGNSAGLAFSAPSPSTEKFIELKIPINRITRWNVKTVSGVVGGMKKGGLYIYFYSNHAYDATTNYRMAMQHRLTFTDM